MRVVRTFGAAATGLALVAAPAQADQATFVEAFNICFDNVMTVPGIRGDFFRAGWQEYNGMSPQEFEYDRNGTHVFLRDTETYDQPGCTVMDETISIAFVNKVLVTALDADSLDWRKGSATGGSEMWRALTDLGTVYISYDEDTSGEGGAISFELHL